MKHIAWASLLWLAAAPAHAYLIDANDARVVAPGSMELELQPIGYYQTLIGEEGHYLIAPSLQLYVGLAEDWDLLYLTRGYVALDGTPDVSPYSLAEQFVAVRRMIVHGRYDQEEGEGPSLALQTGIFLPGIEAETGVGASVALLFAWSGDPGTLHLNAWLNYTQDATWDFFGSVVLEGPADWPVRPTVELWADIDDGAPTVSGLIGAVGSVTDEFCIQAGARVGGWEDALELEVRLSTWIAWDLGGAAESEEPTPRSSDPEAAAPGRSAARRWARGSSTGRSSGSASPSLAPPVPGPLR